MNHCSHCDGKEFVFSEYMGSIIRCQECNPLRAGFAFIFIPHPEATREETRQALPECFAESFMQAARFFDGIELESKF
jgi:hypothetical protein